MEKYDAMDDSELRDIIAYNLTRNEFETAIYEALSKKQSFCYETNFDAEPVFWTKQAKQLGYHVELHFYCLETLELAKQRVFYRTINKGHFVSDETIEYKWKEGYKNLNMYFYFFDNILLIDNSSEEQQPENLCCLDKRNDGEYDVEIFNQIPRYAKRRFPELYKLLKSE